ncbi:MAG: hypothetical protein K2W86_01740 [Sphingomonas sp.]|uniref:hypothetical protein n=1 Tax=Sphingomonas sp. TaxID=28214 RepID=UPI0035A913A3|nr:hypothetical protein [Sphingomonas sp.]
MRARLHDHIEQKFAAAVIDNSPFPHVIIEDFFPDDIYERLVDFNPFRANVGVEWLKKADSKDVSSRTPYYARKQINFHENQAFEAPADQQAFWNEIKSLFLGDNWFPELVASKFPEIFRYRFGDLMDDADVFDLFRRELFLQRHEPGYYIGPHTDIPTRVFTCIFSFAREIGWERYGTELLAPKDRLDRCWGNDHHGYERFAIAKVAPYKPNNFLLFHKTRQSFHSVTAIGDDVPDQRYGMQFQFYEPSGGLFNDLSAPKIMHVIRPQANNAGKTDPI